MNTCLEPLKHRQSTRNNNNKYAAGIPRLKNRNRKKGFWFQGPPQDVRRTSNQPSPNGLIPSF